MEQKMKKLKIQFWKSWKGSHYVNIEAGGFA